MFKKLFGVSLIMGIIICTQGAWAKSTDTDVRLQALEDKIDALQKERLALNTNGLSLVNKVVAADDSESYLKVKYSYPGFQLTTADGLFSTKLVWRAQQESSITESPYNRLMKSGSGWDNGKSTTTASESIPQVVRRLSSGRLSIEYSPLIVRSGPCCRVGCSRKPWRISDITQACSTVKAVR